MHKLFVLSLLAPLFLHAQNVSVTTEKNKVYRNVCNPLIVNVADIPCNELVFKTDNGEVYRNDCRFTFYTETFGAANITIYRQTKEGQVKVGEQSLNVGEINKPMLMVGSGQARMPAFIFKEQDSVRVESFYPDNIKYKVQKFNIILLSAANNTYKTISNIGNKLSPEAKLLLSTVNPNDMIIFDSIAVTEPSGETIYIDDRMMSFY